MIEFIRFPLKLTFALLSAMIIGFTLNLEMPRWAIMTAGIVAGGTAFAAGGDPFSGALRYRGILRIIGTFFGSAAALFLIMTTVQAPVLLMLLACTWAGFCVWLSSLAKIENASAMATASYTALTVIVTIEASGHLTLAPVYAIERCSEIVLGILCTILADFIFSPRSIKKTIEHEVDSLLVLHYKLLRLCIAQTTREEVDNVWKELVRRSSTLRSMTDQLKVESSGWNNACIRLVAIHDRSLAMITHAMEIFLSLRDTPGNIPPQYHLLLEKEADNIHEVHNRMKMMRYVLTADARQSKSDALVRWVGAATEYLLMLKGVKTNVRITSIEKSVLQQESRIAVRSAETHHAMINGIRTFVATSVAAMFWLYTGWTSGSSCMILLGVVTALAMRSPNPLAVAKDFVYGMIVAAPVSYFLYVFILPATQQSMLLLCITVGSVALVCGFLLQKRQLGTMGAFAGILNAVTIENPMVFHFTTFLDNVLGQIIGSCLAMAVILLIPDKSKARTGRKIMNRLMFSTISAVTAEKKHSHKNHLPALYQQLFMLLNLFPGDINKYRIALMLIISHQKFRKSAISHSLELYDRRKKIRTAATKLVSSGKDYNRLKHFKDLLEELKLYLMAEAVQPQDNQFRANLGRLITHLEKYEETFVRI